ncbi:MAG: beta-galactosidase [Lachnospiraceae bacterium]|nr:beta-galactosidase [Lachnospiraceae bacterium]
MQDFYFGAAYYAEYMPYERIDQDFQLMKDAGMNVIRIAESTWSTWEPEDDVYDFTHLRNMLAGAEKYGLQVIIGTPTYAVPAWLAKKYPDIMAVTAEGTCRYGHRQLFDLTNPHYRFHAERIIRHLMEEVKDHPAVIGYQLDNETRSAGAAAPETQTLFVEWLKKQYPDINAFNHAFGLDYWSNRIAKWEDFPDIRGTINGSLSAAYKRFLREAITEFLHWQARIVNEYRRPGQFITHNFDYAWTDHSVGLQPLVDQPAAAACMDTAGCDIYHPSRSALTGAEISMGGAIARSLKKDSYLVLETQAQGRTAWLPYPGQLRLQAFSHLANGAQSVMYWNWHSIHNAIESYWKGVLSHDLLPGRIYREIAAFGKEIAPLTDRLSGLQKENRIAILLDNASQSGLEEFPIDAHWDYNAIFRAFHDVMYRMNLESDVVYAADDFSKYALLVVPTLYSASEETIQKLDAYVKKGGHLLLGYKSCFADRELKIYADQQPHLMTGCIGASYSEFTIPEQTSLCFTEACDVRKEYPVLHWMELLQPNDAEIWAAYSDPAWKDYAAITHHAYGKGTATYLGCQPDDDGLEHLLQKLCPIVGISIPQIRFPLIMRCGISRAGKKLCYYLNYSSKEQTFQYHGENAVDLLSGKHAVPGGLVTIAPWGLLCLESEQIE